MRKKVIIGKPPKAFVGMAMAGAQAAMSIVNGIKAKKEAKRAATAAEKSALTQQTTSDQLELDEYPEEGIEDVNYYQATGGKLGVRTKKTEPTEKDLDKSEVKEVSDSSGIAFNSTGANQLFGRTPSNEENKPSVNFGKYKKVGYFEMGNTEGNTIRVRNTSANPHNAETMKPIMDNIRNLNPGKEIALDYRAGGGTIKGGGSHNTLGGKLNPLSSDMELAEGNTHESSKIDGTSGIKLIQGEKAVAEIEDDETVKDGSLVYSDRLKASDGKTFADNAERLARQKGKAEKRLGKGDAISKATSERRVGMIDQAENALFMEQEQYKKDNNIEQGSKVAKAAMGGNVNKLEEGGFAKLGEKAAPYLDNVANAAVSMFMTPKVPKPSYVKARQLETDVNVNPQLNVVNDAVSSASTNIMSNTSNSNTARANVSSARLRGAGQKANILANEENQENSLKNANTQMQMQTDAINAQKRDGFNMANASRQGQLKSEISANFANMSGDMVDGINNKKDEAYNNESLAAFKVAYNKNGIGDRSDAELEREFRLLQLGKRANGGKIKVRKRE